MGTVQSPRAGVRAALLAIVATCAALAAAAPARAVEIYVSLGDSYTSGPLIPNPKGEPVDCGRSDHNYPTLVANVISPREFRDPSCGSAQTRHMTEPQGPLPLGGTNPPQFNHISPEADLVTLGIGGNDMGFGSIVNTCGEMGVASGGRGQPCTDHYTAGGRDQIAERLERVVAPRLAATIQGLQSRSPAARLLVVGYPNPLPHGAGCYPIVPIAPGDLPYLHRVARNLNATVRTQAELHGGEFVDLASGSVGHDFCQLPGQKWYEGIVPTEPAYPAHPNVRGMEFAAREVLSALRVPVPNDFTIPVRRGEPGGLVALRLRAPYRGGFDVRATTLVRRPGTRRLRAIDYGATSVFAPRRGDAIARVAPIPAARRALAGHRTLRVILSVTYRPIAGVAQTERTSVWVRAARRASPRRASPRRASPPRRARG